MDRIVENLAPPIRRGQAALRLYELDRRSPEGALGVVHSLGQQERIVLVVRLHRRWTLPPRMLTPVLCVLLCAEEEARRRGGARWGAHLCVCKLVGVQGPRETHARLRPREAVRQEMRCENESFGELGGGARLASCLAALGRRKGGK